jgi:hypothetical protein
VRELELPEIAGAQRSDLAQGAVTRDHVRRNTLAASESEPVTAKRVEGTQLAAAPVRGE